jgi:C1A family cysteine protease
MKIQMGLAKGLWLALAGTLAGCGLFQRSSTITLSAEAIQQANQSSGANWTAGSTSVSRLSAGERLRRLGLHRRPGAVARPSGLTPAPASPPSVDWRASGMITPIKDQGDCGSCWAFATTAGLEAQILIHQGVTTDLSEQVLVSCGNAGSCDGGYIEAADNFLSTTGLPPESAYPYTATNGSCSSAQAGWQSNTETLLNKLQTPQDPGYLEYALATYGPVVAAFEVYADFFYYTQGVYKHVKGGYAGAHAVLVVGYDHANQFFIVKNSWGKGWGENGFFRIAYSEMSSMVSFGEDLWAYNGVGGTPTPAPPPPHLTVSVNSYDPGGKVMVLDGNTAFATAGSPVNLTESTGSHITLAYSGYLGTSQSWSGDCAQFGTSTAISFNISQDMNCTFNVANNPTPTPTPTPTQPTLTVTINSYDSSSSIVIAGPPTIAFATAGNPVTETIAAGTSISLGYNGYLGTSQSWSGDCASFGSASTIQFNLTQNMNCTYNVVNNPSPPPPPPQPTPTPTTTPTPPPAPSATYVGCFTDDMNRDLKVFLRGAGATVETCTAAAAAAGYAYAGVQDGGQCFADNSLNLGNPAYTQVADSNCNMPCTANTSETCGGSFLNSIYSTGATPGALKASFKTLNGDFVCAEGGGGAKSGAGGLVDANRLLADIWETFGVVDGNPAGISSGDIISLSSYDGSFMTAVGGGGGEVDANRAVAGAWEAFTIIKVGGSAGSLIQNGDQVALQTINGNFLSADQGGGGSLAAAPTTAGAWETFTITLR